MLESHYSNLMAYHMALRKVFGDEELRVLVHGDYIADLRDADFYFGEVVKAVQKLVSFSDDNISF